LRRGEEEEAGEREEWERERDREGGGREKGGRGGVGGGGGGRRETEGWVNVGQPGIEGSHTYLIIFAFKFVKIFEALGKIRKNFCLPAQEISDC